MLSSSYFFVVKAKLILAKSLPPLQIEHATLRPWYLQSRAYPIPQVSIEGYLTSLVLVQ